MPYLDTNGLKHYNEKLKQSLSSQGGGLIYSEEERVVGTWIDGRDVWEKTYVYQIKQSSSSQGFTAYLETRDDVDAIIDASGCIYRNSRYAPTGGSTRYSNSEVIPSATTRVSLRYAYMSSSLGYKWNIVVDSFPSNTSESGLLDGEAATDLYLTIRYIKQN